MQTREQSKSDGLIQEIMVIAVARITNRRFLGKEDQTLRSRRTSLYSTVMTGGKKYMLGSPTALNFNPAIDSEEYFILM